MSPRWAIECLAFAVSLMLGACTDGGVVGGRCRTGLTECDGRCVDLSADSESCGACGHVCLEGVACGQGVCGFSAGAGGMSSNAGAGGASGGGTSGGAGGASGGVGGTGGYSAEGGMFGDGGMGGIRSAGGAAGSTNAGGTGGGLGCDPPLVACGEQCVDLNVDADHCGRCNHRCASGLCQGGQCVGANVGHIVLACMDFAQVATNAPQGTVLGNAVFIPLKSPVRILAYAEHVSQRAQTHVDDTIAAAAQLRGRSYRIDPVMSEIDVRSELSILDYDVLLIYDQPTAPRGELAQTGALWAETLDSFVRSGGVVVALDGGDTRSEMREFIQAAGLLDTSASTDVTATTVYNRAPADGVGLNVISPYYALRNTCAFQTSVTPDAETVFVVTDSAPSAGLGNPVVVHRIRAP